MAARQEPHNIAAVFVKLTVLLCLCLLKNLFSCVYIMYFKIHCNLKVHMSFKFSY